VREAIALVDHWHGRTKAYVQHTATALVHSLLSQAAYHEFLPQDSAGHGHENRSSSAPSDVHRE
jgi:hypothetical protein